MLINNVNKLLLFNVLAEILRDKFQMFFDAWTMLYFEKAHKAIVAEG